MKSKRALFISEMLACCGRQRLHKSQLLASPSKLQITGSGQEVYCFFLQNKSTTSIWERHCFSFERTSEVVIFIAASLPLAPLPITSQLKEGLCWALRWWMLYSEAGGPRTWGKALFGIFRDSQAIFPDDITRQTNNRLINMKNPLYWALLVGMTVLLLEQGKWWICHPWSTCYRYLRVCLCGTVCYYIICLTHVADSLCP